VLAAMSAGLLDPDPWLAEVARNRRSS
jgi:hypothetical protein